MELFPDPVSASPKPLLRLTINNILELIQKPALRIKHTFLKRFVPLKPAGFKIDNEVRLEGLELFDEQVGGADEEGAGVG
jgi:hypothetical protein